MRTYIAKNLQRRCKAIRNAVKQYNVAAQSLDPPRDTLDWSKVSHYTFLEEFMLLQDTRNDVRDKPWAKPPVRESMRMSRRIANARIEIKNVNREARRLHTHIQDEEVLFTQVLGTLKQTSSPLYGAVSEYIHHRRAANARNLAFIYRMHALEGFTGNKCPGVRVGTPPTGGQSIPDATAHADPVRRPVDLHQDSALPHLVSVENNVLDAEEGDQNVAGESDNMHEEVSGIIEFLARLRA